MTGFASGPQMTKSALDLADIYQYFKQLGAATTGAEDKNGLHVFKCSLTTRGPLIRAFRIPKLMNVCSCKPGGIIKAEISRAEAERGTCQ